MGIQIGLTGAIAVILVLTAGVLWYRQRKYMKKLKDEGVDLSAMRRELSQVKTQLATTTQQLNHALDAAFDGILVLDAQQQVVSLNQVAQAIFGTDSSAIGKTLMTVTRQHELENLVQSSSKNKETLESQITIEDKTYRVRCTYVNPPTSATLVLTLQDISELLRLARARRDMVANFSHDLRTPISSIRLLVDTLTTNFGRNAERDVRLLGKIAGETDSLQHMTEELVDLSRIESGQAIIRMIPIPFSQILHDAVAIMGTQIEQKKIELVDHIPQDLCVLADPEQTRRVVMNLIHNSVKFTPSGGQIIFDATADSQMVTIRARDTGSGIPPQERTRIFERFYQVDASRRVKQGTERSGSGLGLSIAKHIIEAQGGKIWAESTPPGGPGGACILFTIPLAEAGDCIKAG